MTCRSGLAPRSSMILIPPRNMPRPKPRHALLEALDSVE